MFQGDNCENGSDAMSKNPKDDQYSDEETKRRAEQALRGGFKTPPVHEQKKDAPQKQKK